MYGDKSGEFVCGSWGLIKKSALVLIHNKHKITTEPQA